MIDAPGQLEDGRALVDAATDLVADWEPDPRPTWVTAVPSTSAPGRVVDAAGRIAVRLDLPFESVVEAAPKPGPQADLANSYQRWWNVQGVVSVTPPVPEGSVLLVDDVVGSRWTLTEVGMRPLDAGSGPVYPFAFGDRHR